MKCFEKPWVSVTQSESVTKVFFWNACASKNVVVIIILSWGCGSIETGNVFHFAFVGHPSGNLLYNGVSLLWNIWTIFSRPQHFFPISPHNTRYQLNLINEFSVTQDARKLKFVFSNVYDGQGQLGKLKLQNQWTFGTGSADCNSHCTDCADGNSHCTT